MPSIGDLIVNVGSNIASLETGLARANDLLGKFAAESGRGVEDLGKKLQFLNDVIKEVAIAAGVKISFDFVKDLVASSIEAQASLVDLGLKAGVSAEQLSSLIPAARLSGTSLEDVATGVGKFSKNLVEIKDGTGKAADAFRALGLSSQDAARFLQNPAEGLKVVSQRLAQFADDGNKVALAQVLLGRAGANLLPFYHDLAEQGELQARITQQQAEAAKHLEDEWVKLGLRGEDLRNLVVASLVPELGHLLETFSHLGDGPDGLREKIKRLAEEGTLNIWVHDAVIALATFGESLVFIGQAAIAFSSSVQVVINDLKVLAAAASGGATALQEGGIEALLEKRAQDLATANQNWSHLWNDNHTTLSDTLKKEVASMEATRDAFRKTLEQQAAAVRDFKSNMDQNDRALASQNAASRAKPSLSFSIGEPKISEFQKALENLNTQASQAELELNSLFTNEQVTQADRYLATIQNSEAWKKMTADQKATIEGLAEFVSGLQRQAEVVKVSAQNAAAYAQALTDLSRAGAAGLATIQRAQLDAQAEDLKRFYQDGLVDGRQYYEGLTAIQRAEQANQENLLRDQIAVQTQQVDAARQAYVEFTQSAQQQKLPLAQQLSDSQKAAIPLIKALQQLGVTEDQLAALQVKGAQIGKDYYQTLVDQSDGLLQGVRNAELAVARQDRENQEIGLTRSQIALLTAARIDDYIAVQRANGASPQTIANLQREADAARNLSTSLAQGEGIQRAIDGFRELDQAAQGIFESIGEKGQNVFQQLGQSIKKFVLDLIYQLTVKPIIVNLFAQVTGGIGANQLLGATQPGGLLGLLTQGGGGLGGLGNLFGLGGGGGLAGLATSFATSGIGGALGLSTTLAGTAGAEFGAGAAAEVGAAAAGAAGTALTTAGSALVAAVPVVGWAVAAAAAIYSIINANKKPSPVEGQFGFRPVSVPGSTFEDQAFTASKFGNLGFLDQGTQQFSGEAGQVLNKSVAGLLDLFAKRFTDQQIQQTAANLQALQFPHFEGTFTTEDFLAKYGDKILKQVATTAFDVLDPALGKVIDGFTGTGQALTTFISSLLVFHDLAAKLPTDVAASLEAAIGNTQEGLDKVATFATAFLNLQDILNKDPLEDVANQIKNSTSSGAFANATDAMQALIDKFDGSADATTALVAATQQYYDVEVKLIAQIEQVKTSLSSLFEDTIRSLRLSTLNNADQQTFISAEIDRLQQQIASSTNPDQVSQLAQQLNQDITQLFQLESQAFQDQANAQHLTGDQAADFIRAQQQALFAQFEPNIEAINALVQQRLTDLETQAQTQSNDIFTQVRTSLNDAIDGLKKVADQQQATADQDTATAQTNLDASQANLVAATTPLQVVVFDDRVVAQETNG